MTNSMIPYSFVPGTKAKAGEVNANFASLASVITQNQTTTANNIQTIQGQISTISGTLALKADKTELQTTFSVEENNADLDTYLTPNTYVFDSSHQPSNPPVGTTGMLVVTGSSDTFIKQTWYADTENTSPRTRTYRNSTWSSWISDSGIFSLANPGYLRMPNGIIIQWGNGTSSSYTYPLAFQNLACLVVTKNGAAGDYERSDSGITSQSLTGFTFTSFGVCHSVNWIAIGY